MTNIDMTPEIKDLLSYDMILSRNENEGIHIMSTEERIIRLANLMGRGNTKHVNTNLSAEMKELLGGDPIYYRNENEEMKVMTPEERLEKIRMLMGRT